MTRFRGSKKTSNKDNKDQFSNKAKFSNGEKQDDPDLFASAGGAGAEIASLGK